MVIFRKLRWVRQRNHCIHNVTYGTNFGKMNSSLSQILQKTAVSLTDCMKSKNMWLNDFEVKVKGEVVLVLN